MTQIPKIFNAYWDGSSLSYLGYLTIESFLFYNPDWEIRIYTPDPAKRTGAHSRVISDLRQPVSREWEDFWPKLQKDQRHNVKIITIDFDEIGFTFDASEIIRSDYLRYYLLARDGGIWSDLDIIYIKSMDETIFNSQYGSQDFDTMIFYVSGYYPIGFFVSGGNNALFLTLQEHAKSRYNPNEYQCIGCDLLKALWPSPDARLHSNFPGCKIRVEDRKPYLNFECGQLDEIFVHNHCHDIPENAVGIHWFNGAPEAKVFQNNLDRHLREATSTLAILVTNFLQKLQNS